MLDKLNNVFCYFKYLNIIIYNKFNIINIGLCSCKQVGNSSETIVKMPLSKFEPYYRGKLIPDGPTLNVKNITSFGIQVAGGVYENFKQSGLSSFVVDQICAEN